MMRLIKSCAALAFGATLAACAAGPRVEDLPPLGGETESGVATVDGLSFPLPPGQWNRVWTYTVAGSGPRQAPQIFRIYASVNQGVIDRAAVFWVQRKRTFVDRWRQYQGCLTEADPGVLHAVVRTNTGGPEPSTNVDIDCWHLRAFSMGRSGSVHPTVAALQAFADRDGLYLPVTMLSVRFAQKRQTESRDYADYFFNTDFIAPNPAGAPWSPADWSAEAVAADPARRLVVDRLIGWGGRWRPSLLSQGRV